MILIDVYNYNESYVELLQKSTNLELTVLFLTVIVHVMTIILYNHRLHKV